MIRLSLFLLLLATTINARVAPEKERTELEDLENDTLPVRVTCETKACEAIADQIKTSMDDTIDPCHDFYNYGCGHWIKSNPIPEGESVAALWNFSVANVRTHITEILDEELRPNDSLLTKKVKKWFASCMDVDAIEKRGLQPLISTLSEAGGWPMIMDIGEWDDVTWTWQKVDEYYAHLVGTNAFYTLTTESYNGYNNEISLMAPTLPKRTMELWSEFAVQSAVKETSSDAWYIWVDRSEKKRNSVADKYTDFIMTVAMAMAEARGTSINHEVLARQVQDVMKFQIALYKISRSLGKCSTGIYDSSSLNNWHNSGLIDGSQIVWSTAIKELFRIVGLNYDMDTRIKYIDVTYFEHLKDLLYQTPSRTIVNYVHWNFVMRFLKTSTQKMRDLHDAWTNTEEMKKAPNNRYSECMDEVLIKDAVTYEYVKRHFTTKNIHMIKNMLQNIQTEIQYQINHLDWIGLKVKQEIVNSLMYMDTWLGSFNESTHDATSIENPLKFVIDRMFYENTLRHHRHRAFAQYRRVLNGEPVPFSFGMSPFLVNAFFDQEAVLTDARQMNSVSSFRPDYMNYGILGYLIAQTLSYNSSNTDFQYESHRDGMKVFKMLLDAYTNSDECFMDLLIPKSEEILNTIILEIVYGAYVKGNKHQTETDNLQLPGLENLNAKKLFFLFSANMRCKTDGSSGIPQFKDSSNFNQAFAYSASFSEAFECPANAPMSRRTKCLQRAK